MYNTSNIYIGVTDNDWYNYLANSQPDELNFWQLGGKQVFRALQPYDLFLFKLHSPLNYIAGGGFFVRHAFLPVSMAWEAFGNKNTKRGGQGMNGEGDNFQKGELLIYQTEDGKTKIDVFFEDDTIWLNQKQIAQLYQKDIRTISEHVKNIYDDGELEQLATIRKFRIVQKEGNREVSREIDYYNLNMILAIGYRVRSPRGNQFRRWASEILSEYMKKGFVINDDRLKNPKKFGADYFDELLERIRDIRASEKRFYQKVQDIYALSVDYDPKVDLTREFFATVQNKLHYSVHGRTAAELIVERADAFKDNMGLSTYDGSKVRKSDVTIAKNYLNQEEITALNRIVTMYLDYAEDMARQQIPMYMKDWVEALDNFLKFNRRELLTHAGKISRELAEKKAHEQYEIYNQHRIKQADEAAADRIDELEKLK